MRHKKKVSLRCYMISVNAGGANGRGGASVPFTCFAELTARRCDVGRVCVQVRARGATGPWQGIKDHHLICPSEPHHPQPTSRLCFTKLDFILQRQSGMNKSFCPPPPPALHRTLLLSLFVSTLVSWWFFLPPVTCWCRSSLDH